MKFQMTGRNFHHLNGNHQKKWKVRVSLHWYFLGLRILRGKSGSLIGSLCFPFVCLLRAFILLLNVIGTTEYI